MYLCKANLSTVPHSQFVHYDELDLEAICVERKRNTVTGLVYSFMHYFTADCLEWTYEQLGCMIAVKIVLLSMTGIPCFSLSRVVSYVKMYQRFDFIRSPR